MFSSRSILIIALGAMLAMAAPPDDPSPSNMDIVCMTLHCPLVTSEALLNPDFRKLSECEIACNPFYYNDTSEGKLQYQNCTTKCALTYETDIGDKFLACAMSNGCITFAPIDVTCPAPVPGKYTSLASLEGEWWQHYGKNPLWDAYPCQHIHSMYQVNDSKWCGQTVGPNGPVKAPCWSYTYSYDLYTNDDVKYFQQTWQLPGNIPDGEQIDIYYLYMGSTHNETWYILDAKPDRYVVLLDCSYMSGWTNVGSIVWVRPGVVLNKYEMEAIRTVYKERVGWIFPDEFVNDIHGPDNCAEPARGQEKRLPNGPRDVGLRR